MVDPRTCVGGCLSSMCLRVAIAKLVGVNDAINTPGPSAAILGRCFVLSTRTLKAAAWFAGLEDLKVSEVVLR